MSRAVAIELREWLPYVLNSVDAFVSSEDVSKGARGLSDIAYGLSEARYGILCLTKQNISAPWINFEAGALSNKFTSTKVSPLLVDLKRSDIPSGSPLLQFQNTIVDSDDIFKLLQSINHELVEAGGAVSEAQLRKAFAKWWPDLSTAIEKSRSDHGTEPTPGEDKSGTRQSEMTEEILEISRSMFSHIVSHLGRTKDGDLVQGAPLSTNQYIRLLLPRMLGCHFLLDKLSEAHQSQIKKLVSELRLELTELETSMVNLADPSVVDAPDEEGFRERQQARVAQLKAAN